MLDDRSVTPDPVIAPFLTWTYDDNITGWDALLGSSRAVDGLLYAAPARASSVADLPPAFIDVGDLDLFRDEDVEYAQRLAAAGVPCELHVYPGHRTRSRRSCPRPTCRSGRSWPGCGT